MNMKRLVSFLLMIAMLGALALPAAAAIPDGVDWPYNPAWPGYIARRDVPTEVLESQTMEPGLDSLVVKTYPNGRTKAFLFAFDDGGTFLGKPGDNYVLNVLNQNNLRGTFFLMMADGLTSSSNGKGIYQDMGYAPTAEGYQQAIREIYAGHEVATHTLTGCSIDRVNFDHFKYETSESLRRFEECVNAEIAGMAYHYKDATPNPSENNATQEEKDEYLKSIGYRYTRRSIKDGNKPRTYDIPDSFFNWEYDHRIIDNSDDNVNVILPNYFSLDNQNQLKVMTYFAHSWQIHGDGDAKVKIRANFETMCRMLDENRDIVWNTTYLDFVDYVNATRQLDIRFVGDGDISIYNPSKEITCWVDVLGDDLAVGPGETMVIDNPLELDYQPSGYLAHIADNPELDGELNLSDTGTVQVVTDSAQVQLDDRGRVTLTQTQTSQDGDYLSLTDPWLINPMKTTMIDVTYKVQADSYGDDTPLTALGFSMPTVGLVGKAKAATRPVQPTPQSAEGYKTMRIAVDHPAKTIYVSDNGGAYTAISYPYDISYLRNLRLYPMVYPAGGDRPDGTPLQSPVTWTFGSIRVYQPTEGDLLKIASLKTANRTASQLEYTADAVQLGTQLDVGVNVRNYGVENKDFMIIVALYQMDGSAAELVDVSMKAVTGLRPLFIANHQATLDVTRITTGDYAVKAFVWDSLDGLRPYDCLMRTKAQIEAVE